MWGRGTVLPFLELLINCNLHFKPNCWRFVCALKFETPCSEPPFLAFPTQDIWGPDCSLWGVRGTVGRREQPSPGCHDNQTWYDPVFPEGRVTPFENHWSNAAASLNLVFLDEPSHSLGSPPWVRLPITQLYWTHQ